MTTDRAVTLTKSWAAEFGPVRLGRGGTDDELRGVAASVTLGASSERGVFVVLRTQYVPAAVGNSSRPDREDCSCARPGRCPRLVLTNEVGSEDVQRCSEVR